MTDPARDVETAAGRALLSYELSGEDDALASRFGRHWEWPPLIAAIEAEARALGRREVRAALPRALYEVMSRQYGDRYADIYPTVEWDELGPGAAAAWQEDADAIAAAILADREQEGG